MSGWAIWGELCLASLWDVLVLMSQSFELNPIIVQALGRDLGFSWAADLSDSVYHRVCVPAPSAFWLVATDAFLSLSLGYCAHSSG